MFRQMKGRKQPGRPSADNDDIVISLHDRTRG